MKSMSGTYIDSFLNHEEMFQIVDLEGVVDPDHRVHPSWEIDHPVDLRSLLHLKKYFKIVKGKNDLLFK